MSPIKEGYYSYTDLLDMTLDDVLEVTKYISYSNQIDSDIRAYHESKTEK